MYIYIGTIKLFGLIKEALSEKLYEWTKKRWLISFSTEKGAISEKEKKHSLKKKNITEYKNSTEYKKLLKALPDIELTDIEKKDD